MVFQVPKISVIVRTFNESRFIGEVLNGIRNQSNVEVEIVLVDNKSNDDTVSIAKKFVDRIVYIYDFKPGAALNLGVKNSAHDKIASISGHCVPVNNGWLEKLTSSLDLRSGIVGVYGRQIPTLGSSSNDKRDLWTTFGIESRIQSKDPFFHNANSAVLRDVWTQFKFDEAASNVEDRIWAKHILQNGFKIKYEAEAVVDHWHGINHNGDVNRANNVVNALESYGVYLES